MSTLSAPILFSVFVFMRASVAVFNPLDALDIRLHEQWLDTSDGHHFLLSIRAREDEDIMSGNIGFQKNSICGNTQCQRRISILNSFEGDEWWNMVKGVVGPEDLPLNISRANILRSCQC